MIGRAPQSWKALWQQLAIVAAILVVAYGIIALLKK
jgi:hypothetical protein